MSFHGAKIWAFNGFRGKNMILKKGGGAKIWVSKLIYTPALHAKLKIPRCALRTIWIQRSAQLNLQLIIQANLDMFTHGVSLLIMFTVPLNNKTLLIPPCINVFLIFFSPLTQHMTFFNDLFYFHFNLFHKYFVSHQIKQKKRSVTTYPKFWKTPNFTFVSNKLYNVNPYGRRQLWELWIF